RGRNEMIGRLSNTTALAAVLMAARAAAQEESRRIVISIPDRKLVLIVDGQVVKTYDTAVGAAKSPSPSGVFTIVNRIEKPAWYGPKQVVGPGKSNPLGTRWMGLSKKSYGIHGTNAPKSIGRNASHGCVRMRNRDVEELFKLVEVGDIVEIVAERTEEIAALFGNPESADPVAVAAE
ncbi:MAG: L,D-transpeptidase, partial [Bryobacteraceae bacterium]